MDYNNSNETVNETVVDVEPSNQVYQNMNMQPNYNVNNSQLEEPVSIGEWVITMLVMMVPCVNIIMMFVWAFGKSEKRSKSNYFKATLIFTGVVVGIYILMFLVLGVSTMSMLAEF